MMGEFPPQSQLSLLNTIKTMANVYKNAGFDLSTTNLTTVYTVPTDRTAIVKSIQINNDDSSAIQVEISVTDTSASATYKIYHKDLAADTTDNGVVLTISFRIRRYIKNTSCDS